MGKALYRSYRSKTFDEVVGQKHITDTLKNSVKNGTYVHAYLLTGPRGVGKTSVARILAHAVNKVDYPADPPYVDIIEIDAASNRRIDEIRELRERVVIAPTSLKYKVYIIDEVHMLTREAFNALLKTLEEPPEHAIFILATTDFHKVPDTIASRCVRFHFRPVDSEGIKTHLSMIAKSEKIKITDEALEIIAENSDGSFRDAIALLDQVRSYGKEVTKDTVRGVLGLGSEQTLNKVLEAVVSRDAASVLIALEQAYVEGADEKRLSHQLIQSLRTNLISTSRGMPSSLTLSLLDNLLDVASHGDVRTALELALLKATVDGNEPVAAPGEQSASPQKRPDTEKSANSKDVELRTKKPKPTGGGSAWKSVLDDLKASDRGLYSIARMAKSQMNKDGDLRLEFEFSFHAKQLDQAKNRQTLSEMLQKHDVTIRKIDIVYVPAAQAPEKSGETLKDISNIFGASEVLES